ncbi:MAG: InlB B-repeat-containing protein [Lachnospiraceae bacterium]|nr:InlB B-repeat-containing protein [Lachnospiraceae bacterium]
MSKRCLGCMKLIADEYNMCPHCGYVVGTPADEPIRIEPGTLFHNRYIIGKVLGSGGFGATYLAWDGKLEQKVAIKEYMPNEFSTRIPGQNQVSVLGGEKTKQFYDGMAKFLEEAKKLAKFQNEDGIVRIFDSFEENGTAYLVMEFLEGMTLSEYLREKGNIPENAAVELLMPVMKSLQAVHSVGIIHRDITPDNIFVTTKGELKLIDFGASRFATTSHSRSLTVIIKPGYSPEEQYRSRGDQGPHTDVYALGATLYKMITGKLPPDAMERRVKYENESKDILKAPHKLIKGVSVAHEIAILNALNVRIEDRTPDIKTFIEELNADPPAKRRYGKIKKLDFYTWPRWAKIAVASLALLLLIGGIVLTAGLLYRSSYKDKIVVPDDTVVVPEVEQKAYNDAVKSIEEKKLIATIIGSAETEYIDSSLIILQSPSGGSYLKINGQVELLISKGKLEKGKVPYVVASTEYEAIEMIEASGLKAVVTDRINDDAMAAGLVLSQSIDGGTDVEPGTEVGLVISLGPKAFEMPDVMGKEEAEAEKILTDVGLLVTKTYRTDDSAKVGTVLEQSIGAGEDVVRGDTINLCICTAASTIKVPNVVGKDRKDAKETLEKAGFTVNESEDYSNDVAKDKVVMQTPEADSEQLKNTKVTILISKGARTVDIDFDANGGSVDKNKLTVVFGQAYGELPTATKQGYFFGGWYTAKEGGMRVNSDTLVAVNGSQTLYAQWANSSYKVSFDANGGKASKGSIEAAYDFSYGELPTAERAGYDFAGWYTSANGGERIAAASIVKTSSDHTLYAHWNEANYMVMFDANGGSVSQKSQNVKYLSNYGNLPSATKTGYTFKGWYTRVDGGDNISSNSKVTMTSDHTLYAQWTANTYTLKFDANDGTADQTSKQITFEKQYGNLPGASRNGYGFLGWFTDKVGGSQISDTTILKNAGDQTVYAHWKAGAYTVSFDGNGGVVSKAAISVEHDKQYGTLATAERTGYTFSGWFTSKTGGNEVKSTDTVKITSDQILYARWTINTYEVSFNGNGGSNPKNIAVTYDSTYGSLPTSTRTGYQFSGWYTSSSGGNKVESTSKVSITSNQTLYAHWNASPISVSFNGNGGTNPNSITVTYNSTYGTLPSSTRTGYTFDGWYTSASGGSKVTSTTKVTTTTTQTLYAHWSANDYTYNVEYKSSNGTLLGTDKVTHTFGSTYTVSAKEYAGYVTPSSKSVTWNKTSDTITFSYNPRNMGISVAIYPMSGKTGTDAWMTEKITVEYRNRTANSVQLRFTTELTLKAWSYEWDSVAFNAGVGGNASTNDITIVPADTWSYGVGYARTETATSNWITVTGLSPDTWSLNVFHHLWDDDRTIDINSDGFHNFDVNIAKY